MNDQIGVPGQDEQGKSPQYQHEGARLDPSPDAPPDPADPPQDRTLAQAARTLSEILKPFEHSITPGMAGDELVRGVFADGEGASQMALQLQTLDALYNRFVMRALDPAGFMGKPKPGDNRIDKDFAKLALRAQAQCQQTVRTIAKHNNKLKGPAKKP